jgi:uncharacterized protein
MFAQEDLLSIARETMPFGKYKDQIFLDLPEAYLIWFKNKGWPTGKLGELLELSLEIKINGLEYLVTPLKHSQKQTNIHKKAHFVFEKE